MVIYAHQLVCLPQVVVIAVDFFNCLCNWVPIVMRHLANAKGYSRKLDFLQFIIFKNETRKVARLLNLFTLI